MSLIAPPSDQVQTLKLPDQPSDLDLSDDGKHLAVAVRSGKGALIRVLNTKDGSVAAEYADDATMGVGVGFVDGGRSLVYVVRDDKSHHHTLYRAKIGSEPNKIDAWTQSEFRASGISRSRKGALYAINGNKTQIRQAADDEILREVPADGQAVDTRSCFDSKGEKIWVYGTKKSSLVQFEVGSGKELMTLAAPSKFGQQIVASPDDRYLAATGQNGTGLAIYDLAGKVPARVSHDARSLFSWDDEWEDGGVLAFSSDSSLAVFITVDIEAFKLPKWEHMNERTTVTEPGAFMWWSASAYDVPMMAFGGKDSRSVIWFPLTKK